MTVAAPATLAALAALLALGLPACSRPSAAPPAPAPAPAAPADPLLRDRTAFRAEAVTTVTIARPGGTVTLTDRRTLRRAASGDFAVQVDRTHAGSEAGDTEESFRAVRVGDAYYTRGSGGAFVRWDDARDEPGQAEASVLQGTRDLLAVVDRCGRPDNAGPTRSFSLAEPGCPLASTPTGAPFTATVTALQAEERTEGDRLASLRITLGLAFEASGRRADVTLEHALTLADLPSAEAPAAPADAVPARRQRPVQMARSILGGLVDAFGPGAPDVLRRTPAPDR